MNKSKSLIYVGISYIVALVLGYISFKYFNSIIENLLVSTLLANVVTTFIIFIFSIIANNSSIYDPYWSFIPPFIYVLWLIILHNPLTVFSILVGIVIVTWSFRLTLNWLINWNGLNHEDWRYRGFRQKVGKWYWLVSFFAIHLFPTLMVYAGLLPIYYGLQSTNSNFILLIIGFIISLSAVYIALLADKALIIHRNSTDAKQSITSGVWRYTRHPNYLGEILFWFGCFIMGISATHHFYTIIGFIAMLFLFEGYSIPTMEKRLLNSKSDYLMIQNTIPRLFPLSIRVKNKS